MKEIEEKTKQKGNQDKDTDDEEERDMQVIAGGLEKEQDEEEIKKQVNDAIKMVQMENKVQDVFTFKDPSVIGVIHFKTKKAKTTFLQKVVKEETMWNTGNKMWFRK